MIVKIGIVIFLTAVAVALIWAVYRLFVEVKNGKK
jgi:hypothetical protein